MEVDVSPLFYINYNSLADIAVNQGGARSGKTYSILQVLVHKYCLQHTGLIIDIVRKTQAEIRSTLLPDWEAILESDVGTDFTVMDITTHRASYLQYTINGNVIRFIGMDKAQKKRGAKRHILYINEANGITYEDWLQLSIRTEMNIYIDFNPSEEFWFHDVIQEGTQYLKIDKDYVADRDNPIKYQHKEGVGVKRRKMTYEFITSTYLDNIDFLSPTIIANIENLIGQDYFYEQVYVHGNLTAMKGKIYTRYKLVDQNLWNSELKYAETFYGLDPGFVHKMAMIEVKYHNEKVYERCRFLEEGKLDEDFITWLETQEDIGYNDEIYCDSAMPSLIKKLQNKGYNARKSNKDVHDGIRFCQSLDRYILNDEYGQGYIRQMKRYKFKQLSDGKILDGEPVKIDDDGPDAMRYAEYTHLRLRINPIGVS